MIEKLRPLVEAGFAIVLLRPRSKMPVQSDWTSQPVLSFKQLQARASHDSNFGVRLGKPSKIDGLFLHAIDVDIRKVKYEDEALEALEELFPGIKWRKFPQVKSGSGGPSFHIYFLTDTAFKSKKLAKSAGKFTDSRGKVHNYWEIELFGTGKQVVLPPSIHPDTGNPYRWLEKPDFDAFPEIDSELIADLVSRSDDGEAVEREAPTEATDLETDEIADILDELQDLANDRDGWLSVGMALKHQLGEKRGWPIFDRWSKKGEGYDRDRNWIDWRSFKNNHPNPKTMRTLIREYRDRMRIAEFEALDEEDEVTPKKGDNERSYDDGPEHLLRVPGELQAVVDYYNENNMVDQPQFAVLAALAFGSVVLGRNYATAQWNNFASIFLMGIGESGAGKEFIRKTVSRHLRACGFDKMIGPDDLTSESALFAQFTKSPKLLIPTDEFGKRFGSDKGSQDAYRSKLYAAYLNIFGILDDQWQPTGFSTQGKSKEEAQALMERWIVRPSPTLMFTSTPSTFFDAIGSGDVKSGFMSRFVIVQGRPGLQRQRIFNPKNVISNNVVKWAKFMACRAGDPDEDMLLQVDQSADVTPFLLPFSKKAVILLDEIEGMRFEKMVELQDTGLYEILNRAREIAMRISMIIALSEDYETIQRKHLEWAWDFVLYHAQRTVDTFSANLGRSELHLMADKIAAMVKATKEKGLTALEVGRKHHAFKALSTRDSSEVLELLKRDYGIVDYQLTSKRRAFVAPKFAPLKKERPK